MQPRQAALALAAKKIFHSAINAVMPLKMMRGHLRLNGSRLSVGTKSYNLQANIHVVGFGKAVLPMAKAVDDILGEHIVNGVISVPSGTLDTFKTCGKMEFILPNSSRIQVLEGAKNNMPDEDSLTATVKIMDVARNLQKDDILLVLISGGGSALLTSPVPPVTLEEKCEVIKLLANAGASIEDLNNVRKPLSLVKGGGLATLAYPAQVVGLILSDIVGDPLDQVASGPTFPNRTTLVEVIGIVQKHGVWNSLPESVKKILSESVPNAGSVGHKHVNNFLVGNNSMAVDAACKTAEMEGFHPFVLSKSMTGDAKHLGETFALFSKAVCGDTDVWKEISARLSSRSNGLVEVDKLQSYIAEFKVRGSVCLISAGETTVTVTGHGVGGRNQEMVLACATRLRELETDLQDMECVFLSGGTDGIDGPTNAAGAVTFRGQARLAAAAGLEPKEFLRNNDSNTFYSKLDNGEHLVKTGITGTNVMDIQIFIAKEFK